MDENPKPVDTTELDKETWNKNLKEAVDLRHRILDQIERIFPDNDDYFLNTWGNKLSSYKLELMDKGIHPNKYAIYHVFIGSTPSYENQPQCDIPGQNSIMRYFQRYLEELKEREITSEDNFTQEYPVLLCCKLSIRAIKLLSEIFERVRNVKNNITNPNFPSKYILAEINMLLLELEALAIAKEKEDYTDDIFHHSIINPNLSSTKLTNVALQERDIWVKLKQQLRQQSTVASTIKLTSKQTAQEIREIKKQ